MSALGSLVVKLALEYAQFSKGLEDSEQDVKKHAKSVQDAYDRMAAGVSERATNLRDTVVGVFAGAISVAGLMAAMGKVRTETVAAEQEQRQLEAAIKSTGQAAGWSLQQLNAMADTLADKTTFSAGELNQAQARMLSYSGIVGETFPRAMQAAADMSARMGTSITASAESIGRALDIPSAGLTALTQQGFRFTEAQKVMVQQLERTGRVAEAQAIILEAVEASYGGAAAAARNSLGGALQAIANTVNDLMTADSASLPDLRDSLEGLNSTLGDESVRAAVQSLVGGVVDLGSFAATTAAQIINLGAAVSDNSGTISAVFAVLAGAGTAAGVMKVAAAIGGAGGVVGMLAKVRGAWMALTAVMLANPAGLALLGLGAAVGGAYALSQNTEMQNRALERAAEGRLKILQAQKKQLEEYVRLDPTNARDASELARVNRELDEIATSKLTSMANAAQAAAGEMGDAFADMASAVDGLAAPLGQSDEWVRRFGSTSQKAALEVAEWKRKLGDAFTPAMQAQVEDYWAKQDAGAKAGAQSAKQLQQAYSTLKDSIAEKAATLRAELLSHEKLTESDKLRIKLNQDLQGSLAGLSAAKREALGQDIDALARLEAEVAARKTLLQLLEEERKHRQEWWAAQAKSVEELQAGNQQIRAEIQLIGLNEQQQARLNRKRQEAILLTQEQQLAQLALAEDAVGFMSRQRIALEQEIEARRELLTLLDSRTAAEANATAAKKVAEDWERTAQTVRDTLADYIMAGGKDAATYLKRLFSTLVLQPIVQAGVGAVFGRGGASLAGGGGTNAMGLLQPGQSLWSAFSGGLTGTLGTSLASLGAMMGSSAATAFGSGIIAGGNLGLFGGGIGQGLSMIGSGAAGTTAAGLGTIAGAALPWVAGAAALYSLVKSFDNSGTPHMGAGAIYSDGKVSDGRGIYNRGTFGMGAAGEWSSSNQAAISGIAGTLGGALDGFAKAFGKEAGYTVATAFADDSSGDGAWGSLRIADALGNVLVDWEQSRSSKWAPRIFADGEAGYQQYLSAVAGDVKKAFLAMDLPGWADEVLSAAKDIDTLGAAIQQIGTIKTVFDTLGKSMAMLSGLSGAVQTKLLQVSGGIDVLATNAGQFYDLYYSDAEKQTKALAQLQEVFTEYGTDVPATREEFRALVEAQLAAGESGAEFAAVLLGLSSQFASVSDAWTAELSDMSKSVEGFFASLSDSIAAAQADVAASRQDILRGNAAMTAQDIAAAIAGVNTSGPNMDGLNAAAGAASSAAAAVAQAQAVRDAYAASAGQQQTALSELQGQRSDAQAKVDSAKKNADDTYAWAMDQWLSRKGSYSYRKDTVTAMVQSSQAAYAQTLQQMTGVISGLDAAIAQQQGVYDDAAAAAKVYADQLAAAQAVLEATQKAQVQAQVDYAAAMTDWVVEAGSSVSKLSALRGEVVDYYAAQEAAVQAMLQSAVKLRSVVDQLRLGQLDTAQTAAELGSRYATDYAMALATTGSTRAGYVDAMAGNLPALTDALKAQAVTGEDWRIQTAKLFAQANNAANLLEGDAKNGDFQEVALGLLDSIDSALAGLSGATKSAEEVITDAIKNGTQAQLGALRAVIAALKGEPIPAFATGGMHLGGLRIVGERGPELEATGPARIWNASQTAAMLGGSANMERVEQLLLQRNEEARAQASAIVRLQQDMNRLLMRWETQGLPEEREVSA